MTVERREPAAVLIAAGRTAEAIPLYEKTLADCERVLGLFHPMSRTARANLVRATAQKPSGDSDRRTRKSRWFRR